MGRGKDGEERFSVFILVLDGIFGLVMAISERFSLGNPCMALLLVARYRSGMLQWSIIGDVPGGGVEGRREGRPVDPTAFPPRTKQRPNHVALTSRVTNIGRRGVICGRLDRQPETRRKKGSSCGTKGGRVSDRPWSTHQA